MKLGMAVGLGPGHIVLDGNPALLSPKEHSPPILGPCLLRPNGWLDQDATWYGGRPRPRQHCARRGLTSPRKGGTAAPNFCPMYCGQTGLGGSRCNFPQFSTHVLWRNGWMDQDAAWYRGRPRPRPHFVRWRLRSPSSRGTQPQLSAHVCCGQTGGWIKMLFGMEVGLGPGDIVLDGYTSPPRKGGWYPPIFGPCIVTKRLDDQDARPHCVRWGPSSPKGHSPQFLPHVYCGQNGRPSQLLLSTCLVCRG